MCVEYKEWLIAQCAGLGQVDLIRGTYTNAISVDFMTRDRMDKRIGLLGDLTMIKSIPLEMK